jgi:hypothetical protein
MQFFDYHSHYQVLKNTSPDHPLAKLRGTEFSVGYILMMQGMMRQAGKDLAREDPITPTLLQVEGAWHDRGRPYFNLWPSIIPALTKLKLDADASLFKLPIDQLLVRFPMKHNPLAWTDANGTEWVVRSLLCENARLDTNTQGHMIYKPRDSADFVNGIAFFVDVGEPLMGGGQPLANDDARHLRTSLYKHIVCEQHKSIEWSFENIPAHQSAEYGLAYPEHIVRDVARIICTLCLMSDDNELVEPIVLKADESKWENTHDGALVEKAKRRGNYGFNVGRDIEVVPHVRSACPAALYWTGEGRRVPKIRFRRGTVVHRKKLADMPTGYLDKEEGE